MKILNCTQTGASITLVQQLASSGEGEIWQTDRPQMLAKLYYNPKPERMQKLAVMVAHPPCDPNAQINHISFAWPTSLLQEQSGLLVGFLMPRVADAVELLDVYNPLRRQLILPEFNWLYLHATGMNIASLVWAIHNAGYVLGDLKPQNILVTNGALPSIIDTDSFQVRHPETGELYRCPVGSEGFTPAELMDQDLTTLEQTEFHDRFRLGVLLYLLLFGEHPFKGRWVGKGDSPDPNELVRQGWWPYAPHSPIQPSVLTSPLQIIHPALQDCFRRCFNAGHLNPKARPSAQEWVSVFKLAIPELKRCRTVSTHFFSKTDGHCYWCTRRQQLGVDIFPAPPNPVTERWIHWARQTQNRLKRSLEPISHALTVVRQQTHTERWSAWGQGLSQHPSWMMQPNALFRRDHLAQVVGLRHNLIHQIQRRPKMWWGSSMAVGMTIVLSCVIASAHHHAAHLLPAEMGLTLIGLGFCAVLAVACWFLLRATARWQA
jgi:DNA-binding helix-hairpin-helix protein with protein kinase domain